MKNLWERLSEENQLILLTNQITYPTLYGSIISNLKNTYGWTNLNVSDAHHLVQDLTKYDKDFITILDELFNNN
jgi:hypothetical protein